MARRAPGRREHYCGVCQCILAIPFNRATRHTVEYLEHDEMQALLAMYDTGARVQEILDLRPMERFGSARRCRRSDYSDGGFSEYSKQTFPVFPDCL